MSPRQRGAQPRTRCRRSLIGPLLGLLALLASAFAANATTATLIADTHLSTAQPAVNFGTLTNLAVGNGFTALLQFDLGTLPAGTTAAGVSRATLRLFVNRADTPGLLSLSPISSPWGEYSVTASAAPTLGASIAVTQVSTAGQYVAIDVTNTVQAWIAAPAANFGLALTAGSAALQFDSKENDLTSHPAELDITLTSTSAAGSVGATGPAGPQGPAGATGPQGVIGPPGLTGATGPIGATGLIGPTGPQGPAAVMNYQGLWSSLTTYPANAVITYAGSSYLSLAASNKGNTPGLSAAMWGMLAAAGQNGIGTSTTSTQTLTYQGVYTSATSYASGDIALYNGSSYISLLANNRGNTPAIATSAWGLLAAAGQSITTTSTTQQSLTYQGSYTPQTNYALGDIVQYLGSSFVSLQSSNHGNTPGLAPTAWGLLASALAGPQGVAGSAGPTGPTGLQGNPGGVGPQGPVGPTGVAGPQGVPGLTYQGAFHSTANYALGDIVLWQGITYTSLTASNHGNAPDATPGSWGILATPGPVGPTGTQGPIGLTGPQGYQGLVGPPGPAGPTGPIGIEGPAGAQGLTGTEGPHGDIGPQGLQGLPGQAGAQGIPGAAGPTGLQGPMGPLGPAGPVGLTPQGAYLSSHTYALADSVTFNGSGYVSLLSGNLGNTPDQSPQQWSLFAAAGAPGLSGPAGPPGSPGLIGSPGPTGPTGSAGSQGAIGPQGPPVATFTGPYLSATNYNLNDAVSFSGSTWISLSAGNRGNTPDASPSFWAVLVARGATGAAGPVGATGPSGSTGATGLAGPSGPQGPQGQIGPTGLVGINFRDAWLANANYQTNDAVTLSGSTWIATASSTGVQPGTSTSAWAVLAQAGVTGPSGPSGPTGSAATVTVGSVTTGASGTAAVVTNSGTSTAAVLNFTLPAGATGPAGAGGSGSGGSASTSGIPFASVMHTVSFQTLFYSVNSSTAALNETTSVITWVPNGCTATSLAVYSTQSNTITVTVRTGVPGAMQPSSLSCAVAANGSCTVTGSVLIAPGAFVDLNITGANGAASPVWSALACQ